MSDLISRKAALKKIGQINGILLFNGAILINYLDAEKAIEDLPSFPQAYENDPCNGCNYIDDPCNGCGYLGEGYGQLTDRKEGDSE